jgi:hypothetical protein
MWQACMRLCMRQGRSRVCGSGRVGMLCPSVPARGPVCLVRLSVPGPARVMRRMRRMDVLERKAVMGEAARQADG